MAGSSRAVGGGPVVPSLVAECTDAHEACAGPLRFPNSAGSVLMEFELLSRATSGTRVRYLSFRSGA